MKLIFKYNFILLLYIMEENQINHIIEQYKKKKDREYNNYHNVYKHSDEYMNKNRERAKIHYNKNIDKRKLSYEQNKELVKARSSYNYYKKINNISKFKEKYPDRVKILNDIGILKGIVVNFD